MHDALRDKNELNEKAKKRYWDNPEKHKEAKKQERLSKADLIRERDRLRYRKNAEIRKESARKQYKQDPERFRKRNREQYQKHIEKRKQYVKDNAAYYAFKANMRSKKIKRATPKWADMEKIRSFYVKAKELEAADGIKREVDHIVPIVNKHVCGLNVEFNLQILTASENRSKNNRYDPLTEVE